MEAGTDQGKYMKQLVKSESLGEIWFFQNEDDRADGVGDSACGDEKKAGRRNCGQRMVFQQNRPAHSQIK